MTRVDELLAAVENLPVAEQAEFVRRLHRWEEDGWDQRLIADRMAADVDSLVAKSGGETKRGHERKRH
ncbi:MAG TPA: hypothetical protein VMD30_06695 [Tepidisphaeraceae bacterium]|nr:hypothetical protein [Tepidisphaeraceae bacterium]